MRGLQAFAAVAMMSAAAFGPFPSQRGQELHSTTKSGRPTERDFEAMEKAQAKRDRKAAKRLKDAE